LNQKVLEERRWERMEKLLKFLKDEEGLVAIEYALIATFVALAIIAGITFLGTTLNTKFNSIGNTVAS
jgi:pilus assembly protein Flp/PilA